MRTAFFVARCTSVAAIAAGGTSQRDVRSAATAGGSGPSSIVAGAGPGRTGRVRQARTASNATHPASATSAPTPNIAAALAKTIDHELCTPARSFSS